MVRLSTMYDKDINKRVFVLRGDERYAHSTRTSLTITDNLNETSAYGYKVSITFNVYRDIGSSKVYVYDNDEVIYSTDWSLSQTTAMTITSPYLAWDTEHIIRVEYRGNGQCSPSSASQTLNAIANPNKYTPTLTISTYDQLIHPNHNSTVIVSANCEDMSLDGQDIKLYLDGTLIGTEEVDNDSATFTYQSSTLGKHTLTAEYDGGVNHYPVDANGVDVSVGYECSLTEYPTIISYGESYMFGGEVKSYLGTSPQGTLNGVVKGYVNGTAEMSMAVTITNGSFRTRSGFMADYFDKVQLIVTDNVNTSYNYNSSKYDVRTYEVTSLALDTTKNPLGVVLGSGVTVQGTVSFNGTDSKIPLTIVTEDGSSTSWVSTSSSNKFGKSYRPKDYGEKQLAVRFVDSDGRTIIEDTYPHYVVDNYWSVTYKKTPTKYSANNITVKENNGVFEVKQVAKAQSASLIITPPNAQEWNVKFKLYSINNNSVYAGFSGVDLKDYAKSEGAEILIKNGFGRQNAELYVDGELITTSSTKTDKFAFGIMSSSTLTLIKIDEFMVW